ncbi:MAG: tRNA lysidine(34) synthetase TilS [Thiomicrospira sp.]|uniref:tRNA lysidine(34) synthetase TilS n=1 Tax=Thiomicrospira sp. TaxID=935 RepID=UPI0019F19CF0|nr:tRNA lysidine(34) synthetase TilS [Thiomicrospira sp.]MBE0493218.1 tRNA lysidine(34) synthetase TilS [Thiomicrospira sp.]
MQTSQSVTQAVELFYQSLQTSKVWLAYSGGLDSHVLLQCLVELKPVQVELNAIHVHHGLQAEADDWVTHCQAVCNQLQVPLQVEYVAVDKSQNIESAARKARYQAFEKWLGANEVICTGHHQRDQAETLLLNLMRGAGLEGLSAMPQWRVLNNQTDSANHQAWLVRPLLNTSYDAIQTYAKQHQLRWVEDPTNQYVEFRRNFIRHQLLPLLDQAWSNPQAKLAQASRHQAEAAELLQELAQNDLALIEHDVARFNWRELQKLSWTRQKNLLRYWFKHFHQISIDQASLDWLRFDAFNENSNAQPKRKLKQTEIRRYQNWIYLLDDSAIKPPFNVLIQQDSDWEKHGIKLQPTVGQGLAEYWLKSDNEVRLRSLHEDDEINRDSLKKWFQTQKIPPWQRHNWPVVEINSKLAVIVGYRTLDGFQAKSDEKALNLVGLN